MKIEKIDENKIRVTITLSDLEERNIDVSTLNYNSAATQELFLDMIEQAESEFGFNTTNSQLVVDPEPDLDNGFIVTITKFDDDTDFESIQSYITKRLTKKDLKPKRKSRKIYYTLSIYSFASLEDLSILSNKLVNIFSGKSSLYKLQETYYILLTLNEQSISNNKLTHILLNEYGNKVYNVNFYEGYLNEYGTKLVNQNAFEIIVKYF